MTNMKSIQSIIGIKKPDIEWLEWSLEEWGKWSLDYPIIDHFKRWNQNNSLMVKMANGEWLPSKLPYHKSPNEGCMMVAKDFVEMINTRKTTESFNLPNPE